ncbi:MAG: hypothetical protein KAR19_01510 [Bacteroidales bacterium]|nr:hypothetical protein [Bacteroidales bacterium]
MRLKLLAPIFIISTFLISSCTKDESVRLMPVTTDSELALELYETGMLAFDQIKLGLAYRNLEMAVKEDPDFFMAYFWMYFMSGECSKKIAEKALQSEAFLNDGEKQIKTAFKYLLDGQDEKVVEHLIIATELYPSDPHVYKILYVLQFQFLKDIEGSIVTINRAIEAQPDFALAYNQLGYALMVIEEYGKAEEAFNNYIKLAPAIANPYDSKGDFYMTTEQYDKAFESYMKAFEIDSGFTVSEKKARKAKYLQEKSIE